MNRGKGNTATVVTPYARPPASEPVGQHGNDEHNPAMAEQEDFEAHEALIASTTEFGHIKLGEGFVYDPETGQTSTASGSFIGLSDTIPEDFEGSDGYLVVVDEDEEGLVFIDGSTLYAAIGHDHSGVYSPVGHNHAGVYDPAGTGAAEAASAVAGHVGAGDPHTIYHNDARGDARYSLLSHNHSGVYSPVAHTHTFVTLTDVPSSYSTHGGKLVRVNGGASALEFVDGSTLYASASHNHDSSYVLKAGDTMTGNLSLGSHTLTAGGLTIDTNTLYVDATNNRVGVGTLNPQQAFDVRGIIYSLRFGNQGTMRTARSNGTEASPTVVVNTNNVGQFSFDGQYSTTIGDFTSGADILAVATGDWSTSSNAPTEVRYRVNRGAGLVEKMRVSDYIIMGSIVANSLMTLGLNINQGANDDDIFSLQSSDVAHGITDFADTSTYFSVRKTSGTTGGANLRGLGESSNGLRFDAYINAATTTKSNASVGPIILSGKHKAAGGTGVVTIGSISANSNLVTVDDNGTTRFILDVDGDSHQDVGTAWTNFDDFDDPILLTDLSVAVSRANDPIKERFGEFVRYNRAELERIRLVTFNENGHHFVNMSRLTMLHTGAIRQINERMEGAVAGIVHRLEMIERTLHELSAGRA